MYAEIIFVLLAVSFCVVGFVSLILHLGMRKTLKSPVKPVKLPCLETYSFWKSHPEPGHQENIGIFETIIHGEVHRMKTILLREGKIGQMYDLLLDEQNQVLHEAKNYNLMKLWIKITDIVTIITGIGSVITFPLFVMAIL